MLLRRQAKLSKFDPNLPNDDHGLNVWMIYVVGEKRKRKLLKAAKKFPLRFDSHVFEFYDPDEGKLFKIII